MSLSLNLKFYIKLQANTAVLVQLRRTFSFWIVGTFRLFFYTFVRSLRTAKGFKILRHEFRSLLAVLNLTSLRERSTRNQRTQNKTIRSDNQKLQPKGTLSYRGTE